VCRHLPVGLAAFAAAVAVTFGQPVASGFVHGPDGATLTSDAAPAAGGAPAARAGERSAIASNAPGTGGNETSGIVPDRAPRHSSGPTDPSLLSGYVWPLPRGRITQPFGPSWAGTLLVDGVPFHDGLDIATFCGDHVVAAHDGVVLAAGRKVDPWMGWVGSLAPSVARRDRNHLWYSLPIIIVVDDGNGYRSIYAHFNAINVRAGEHVRAGQFIGWEGSTGFATGCHVHYGLFNPLESRVFALEPRVAKRTKLPALELARIDPLLVLPPRDRLSPIAPGPAEPPATDPAGSISTPAGAATGAESYPARR
jgi:murein DD-endopeptidase MepM/ murein hydrolase activator NlpD